MTTLHIPDTCGIATFRWSFAGKVNPVSTAIGYRVTLGSTTPAEAADVLYDNLTASLGGPCKAAEMLSSWSFIGVDCIQNDGGVLVGGASSGPTVVGAKSSSGGRMIMNTSLVVKKRTARIGHQFRGRCYWPVTSMAEGEIDSLGMIDAGSLTTFQADIDTFFNGVQVDGTVTLVLLHTDPAVVETDISSMTVESQVGTQRRRMR